MDNMSDLQRAFQKAKLAKLPPEAPLIFDENEEDAANESTSAHLDDDSSSASSASSAGTIVPSPRKNLFARPTGSSARRFDSLSWRDFFAQELSFDHQDHNLHLVHHAYFTPPTGSGPLFVTHHGAGSSGLSFATCAAEIRKSLPNSGILSLDARYHGSTTVTATPSPADDADVADVSSTEGGRTGAEEPDFRLETLGQDLVYVVEQTRIKMGWTELPDIVLVGHSLGGAVITDVAKRGDLGTKVLAYAVLDVVEGSAVDALQSMETYIATRPSKFLSLSAGIEWHTRSRTIRNTTSARVSVPSLLRQQDQQGDGTSPNEAPSTHPQQQQQRPWIWRTDLAATKPFWEDWFVGLSKKFLEAKGGKLLLLAGTDRLDKELMIGQMQGKYQLQVLPDAGHFIHEDQPVKTAQILVDFYKRNDRSALVLPPKVGDLMAAKAMEKGKGVEPE